MNELSQDEILPQFSSKENMLEEAIKHRNRLLQLLEMADARIVAIKNGSAVIVESEPKEPPERVKRTNNGMTLSEYLELILRDRQGPVHVNKLAQAALEAGYETESNSRNYLRTVNSRLCRDKRFVRVAPGEYNLADGNV